MAEQRLTRKDIRDPDQFISSSVRLVHWLGTYTKYVVYGILGVVVLIGIVMAWSSWQRRREQQASVHFYETKKLLNLSGRPNESSERLRAREQLENLVQEYSNTTIATMAYWYLGQLAFETRDYTKALTAYQQAQRKLASRKNSAMFAAVALGVAYTQEASGICQEAIANFDTVLQSSAHWLHSEAYLGLGRCYKLTQEQTRANALLDRLLSDQNLSESTRQTLSEQLVFLQRTPSKHTD